MLELGGEPKRLVSTFLAYRNDIDIYTEDELKDKEFYRVLFHRLVGNNLKINDITPLGSRDNVLERCKNEPQNGRKKIFVIDGDVTIIHGNNIPQMQNLFVLDAYCIENVVFDKESVLNFIYLNCATRAKDEIEQELDFERWLTTYSKKLIDLFIHFGIMDFYGGKFTLFNAHKYHKKDDYAEELVEKDIELLKNEILKLTSKENYDAKYQELVKKWTYSCENLLKIVSGKDYLIPILLLKAKLYKRSKATPTIEESKFFLVQYCGLERLSKLKATIESL